MQSRGILRLCYYGLMRPTVSIDIGSVEGRYWARIIGRAILLRAIPTLTRATQGLFSIRGPNTIERCDIDMVSI